LCSFIVHHSLHGFSLSKMIIFQAFLFVDPTSSNSKLKILSYCTLNLKRDVRDIVGYEDQISVGSFLVIEANLILVKLGFSSVYILLGFQYKMSSIIKKM
jgi:hypothetical protein